LIFLNNSFFCVSVKFFKKRTPSLFFSFFFFLFIFCPFLKKMKILRTLILLIVTTLCIQGGVLGHLITVTSHRPYHHIKASKDGNGLKNHVGVRSSIGGGIVIGDCAMIGFSVPLVIGSGASAQSFQVILDTGSGVTGVVSSGCSASNCLHATPVYTVASTAVSQSGSFTMTYGSGSWTGNAYTDTQSIGGNNTFPVAAILFGAITSQSGFLPNTDCQLDTVSITPLQGIVGMSYGDIEGYQSYGMGLNSMFALQLCESGGQMWIGTSNSSYFSSGPNYVNLVSDTSWFTIAVSKLSLAGTTISTSLGVTIVDSGTTLTYIPSAAYTAFTNMLASNATFMAAFPDLLSNTDTLYTTNNGYTTAQLNELLPSMSFVIGSNTYTLTPVDSYLTQYIIAGVVYYGLGIVASSGGSPNTILGYTFMNQFVTFFDLPNTRLGLAPSTACQNVWKVTAWSACSSSCGSGTETRSTVCVNYLNETIPSNACHVPSPPISQSCVGTSTSCPSVTTAATTLPISTSLSRGPTTTHPSTTTTTTSTVTHVHTPTSTIMSQTGTAPTLAALPQFLLIMGCLLFWVIIM
jgi:hypothetical protein